MLINTVDENENKLSELDLTQAKRARALQRRIWSLTICDSIHYVNMNMIPNCPVTIQDIKDQEFIWSPDLRCVKDKTARHMLSEVIVETTLMPVSIM